MTVLEAASEAGGQVRLATQVARRAELIGIVDWRLAELERLGVELHFNSWAEGDDVLALDARCRDHRDRRAAAPPPIDSGGELAVSSWDILCGRCQAGRACAAL